MNRQKPMQLARDQISDLEDVRSVSEGIRRGDVVLVVRVYPWGLDFEVEATGTTILDPKEDATSA